MRIVTKPFLREAASEFPQAASWLAAFVTIAGKAAWKSLEDMRATYPHADAVTTKSKRTVIVLNVGGNKYRLILAVHFNRQIIFTLRFLTHAEYSKDNWKSEL
jgi:mRNA interferase HigB